VPRTIQHALHFIGRVPRGPAHLPGELGGVLRAARFELRAEARQDVGTCGQRHSAPGGERMPGGAQGFIDLLGAGQRPLHVYPPIHRAHGLLNFVWHQMISK
jgi:hypothetical protein